MCVAGCGRWTWCIGLLWPSRAPGPHALAWPSPASRSRADTENNSGSRGFTCKPFFPCLYMILIENPALRLRFSLLHTRSCSKRENEHAMRYQNPQTAACLTHPRHPRLLLASYLPHGQVSRYAKRCPGPARRPAMLAQTRRSREQVSPFKQYVTPSCMACNEQDCAGGAERPFSPNSHRRGHGVK